MSTKMRALCALLSITAACLAGSTMAQAPRVWGIHPATNQIVRVDPSSGSILGGFTPPGGALDPNQMFGGLTLAEGGKVLLYQNPVTNPADLFRIDPLTGMLLSTESMPAALTPEFRAGLSFASDAGAGGEDAIFAINDGGPIQRQDGYGDVTLADHTQSGATFAGALGGDDNGRQFVAFLSTVILEFSATTPDTPINTIPAPTLQAVGGLAFDGTYLYLSDLQGRLYTLNPDTGDILNDVAVEGGVLIGLAASPVPEADTATLLGLTMPLVLAILRLRARNPPD